MKWTEALFKLEKSGASGVLVTILGSAGSAPRKPGSKMLVTPDNTYDTIGGGHLEFLLTEKARKLLLSQHTEPILENIPLGPKLGQCCGGSVSVLLEPLGSNRLHIVIFGAGHVGKALVHVLSPLDCRITWIDNRANLLEGETPDNVQILVSDEPETEVQQLPQHSYCLVVTHNHQLDYAITEAILKQNNSAWLGVIGSETKARRFRLRLERKGVFSAQQIDHMNCPVGLEQVGGRKPAEIAIAIGAEILAIHNGGRNANKRKREGIPWQELKPLLGSAKNPADIAG